MEFNHWKRQIACSSFKDNGCDFSKDLCSKDAGKEIYQNQHPTDVKTVNIIVENLSLKDSSTNGSRYLVHNTRKFLIYPDDFMFAFNEQKIKCPHCQINLTHAQGLLRQKPYLHKVITGICDHCFIGSKQSKKTMERYIDTKYEKEEPRNKIKTWKSNIKQAFKEFIQSKDYEQYKKRTVSDPDLQQAPSGALKLRSEQMVSKSTKEFDKIESGEFEDKQEKEENGKLRQHPRHFRHVNTEIIDDETKEINANKTEQTVLNKESEHYNDDNRKGNEQKAHLDQLEFKGRDASHKPVNDYYYDQFDKQKNINGDLLDSDYYKRSRLDKDDRYLNQERIKKFKNDLHLKEKVENDYEKYATYDKNIFDNIIYSRRKQEMFPHDDKYFHDPQINKQRVRKYMIDQRYESEEYDDINDKIKKQNKYKTEPRYESEEYHDNNKYDDIDDKIKKRNKYLKNLKMYETIDDDEVDINKIIGERKPDFRMLIKDYEIKKWKERNRKFSKELDHLDFFLTDRNKKYKRKKRNDLRSSYTDTFLNYSSPLKRKITPPRLEVKSITSLTLFSPTIDVEKQSQPTYQKKNSLGLNDCKFISDQERFNKAFSKLIEATLSDQMISKKQKRMKRERGQKKVIASILKNRRPTMVDEINSEEWLHREFGKTFIHEDEKVFQYLFPKPLLVDEVKQVDSADLIAKTMELERNRFKEQKRIVAEKRKMKEEKEKNREEEKMIKNEAEFAAKVEKPHGVQDTKDSKETSKTLNGHQKLELIDKQELPETGFVRDNKQKIYEKDLYAENTPKHADSVHVEKYLTNEKKQDTRKNIKKKNALKKRSSSVEKTENLEKPYGFQDTTRQQSQIDHKDGEKTSKTLNGHQKLELIDKQQLHETGFVGDNKQKIDENDFYGANELNYAESEDKEKYLTDKLPETEFVEDNKQKIDENAEKYLTEKNKHQIDREDTRKGKEKKNDSKIRGSSIEKTDFTQKYTKTSQFYQDKGKLTRKKVDYEAVKEMYVAKEIQPSSTNEQKQKIKIKEKIQNQRNGDQLKKDTKPESEVIESAKVLQNKEVSDVNKLADNNTIHRKISSQVDSDILNNFDYTPLPKGDQVIKKEQSYFKNDQVILETPQQMKKNHKLPMNKIPDTKTDYIKEQIPPKKTKQIHTDNNGKSLSPMSSKTKDENIEYGLPKKKFEHAQKYYTEESNNLIQKYGKNDKRNEKLPSREDLTIRIDKESSTKKSQHSKQKDIQTYDKKDVRVETAEMPEQDLTDKKNEFPTKKFQRVEKDDTKKINSKYDKKDKDKVETSKLSKQEDLTIPLNRIKIQNESKMKVLIKTPQKQSRRSSSFNKPLYLEPKAAPSQTKNWVKPPVNEPTSEKLKSLQIKQKAFEEIDRGKIYVTKNKKFNLKKLVKSPKKKKTKKREAFNSLPEPTIRDKRFSALHKDPNCFFCITSDESDCDGYLVAPKVSESVGEIIVGTKIGKLKNMPPVLSKENGEVTRIQSYISDDFVNKVEAESKPILEQTQVTKDDKQSPRGLMRYVLSDRTFIDKGWTMLPTEKVVRKVSVFRMRPTHPEFDWFTNNKSKGLVTYDTGEKLAEIDEKGRGRWFYKNGRVALEYYDCEEAKAQQRVVVYGSGEADDRGRSRSPTILATFDFLGNAAVFDHAGKIRLKYNQNEGVVLDPTLGPAANWKWHSLNDPPVLRQVMVDTHMAFKDRSLIDLTETPKPAKEGHKDEVVAVEIENVLKEKNIKMSQTFRPYQIRIRALKINEYFSLRVIDQANVHLKFRDGKTNMKLNLGFILDNREIIGTDVADVGEVSLSLEFQPAKTESLDAIQRNLESSRRIERARVDREQRVRPKLAQASADTLTAAATRTQFRATSIPINMESSYTRNSVDGNTTCLCDLPGT